MCDHSHGKNVFSYGQWNFLPFSLWPLSLGISLEATKKSQALCCLPPSIRYPNTLIRPVSEPFFSRLNNPITLNSSLCVRCSDFLILSVIFHWAYSNKSLSFLYGESRIGDIPSQSFLVYKNEDQQSIFPCWLLDDLCHQSTPETSWVACVALHGSLFTFFSRFQFS